MKIGLVEAVKSLRDELRDAQDASAEDIKFKVDEIEVTFELTVEKSASTGAEAGGKIQFWLFDVDAKAQVEGGMSENKSHRLTLKLSPTDHTSGNPRDIDISDQVESPRNRSE